ncbi:hypothetical protein HPB52_011151 [Rhipicephalus sanguineus]|uniref:Uncharacterized protein n=1 Tax=Rhipicephalus sanguineus TaxID=34632 RepID=A0A9D4PSN6_RHISA|nr:hypothetical protein HPB52_011151 [Rhipicephalus sanguineus]
MKELLQELSTERTLREELSTKVAALRAEVDKLRPSKGLLATDDTDVHTGDALFTERKNELQPRDSEQQNTAKVLSNPMAKDETEEDREAGPWLKVGKNNRVENPTKEKATTQRSNEQSVPKKWNQPKQQLRYTQSQHRRSVVLGDSNAHRLKRQLHKDVSDWRLRVTTKPGATMEETLLRAEKEIEQANSAETKLQLILHVGSTDILNEKEPHRSIEQLKQKLTAWSQADPQHHYILCATPELTPRGPHVVTACREWNKQANELCTMLGPQVEFFSTTNQMDEDYLEDIHYTEATGTHVGHLLAMKARTGSLATQQRRHELFDSEPLCRLCGAAEETVTHVLQECPRLHDKPRTSPSLPELLGLSGQTEENHFDRVNYTKDLLLRWDRLNREVAITSARETPHTPSSAAPRTDTPPPCGNGSKQTDEKLAAWQGQSCFKTQVENSG